MPPPNVKPTNKEKQFPEDGLIVTKTDVQGRITYANRLFLEMAGYTEQEAMGAPHNIVRHPDMPRGVFKFLWDTISTGTEVFAYVKNMSSSGDFYWVFAHVTATYNDRNEIIGYHSNRRTAPVRAVRAVEPIYQKMLELERGLSPPRAAEASLAWLVDVITKGGVPYDELVFKW
jgi:PAS domain S-box-containing protein